MKFYRDVLDGPLYIVVVLISIVLIMAIIGFILERKKLAKEKQDKIVHVDVPVEPIPDIELKQPETIKQLNVEEMPKEESKPQVIDFTPDIDTSNVEENDIPEVSPIEIPDDEGENVL